MAAAPPPLPQVQNLPPPLPEQKQELPLPIIEGPIIEGGAPTDQEPPRKKRRSRFDDKPPAHEIAKTIAQKFDPGVDPGEIRIELEVPTDITNDPGTNFVGMMIGPGGTTQRQMEAESGARINVRGKGSAKDGQDQDPDRPMYVLIRGDSQAKVDIAAAHVKELLNDKNKREILKQSQMRQRDANAGLMTSFQTPVMQHHGGGGGGPSSETLMIPASKVGIVIGRGGETIQAIQRLSGAHVQVQREHAPEHPDTREIKIQGTYDQIQIAKTEIQKHCAGERSMPGVIDATDHVSVPNNVVGIIIGRSGETIKRLQIETGCTIQVTPSYLTNPSDTERKINLSGNDSQCELAKAAIAQLVDKHRDSPYIHEGIGHETEMVSVPAGCIGILIGKGGENVKLMASRTKTRIQVQKEEGNPNFNEETAQYRHVSIRGDRPAIEAAKLEIQAIIDEHAARHGYDAPQLGQPMHQYFGMEPAQYRQYLDQMQQYYGMDEQRVIEYYQAAVQQMAAGQQMAATGQLQQAATGVAVAATTDASAAIAQAQQAQALAYQTQQYYAAQAAAAAVASVPGQTAISATSDTTDAAATTSAATALAQVVNPQTAQVAAMQAAGIQVAQQQPVIQAVQPQQWSQQQVVQQQWAQTPQQQQWTQQQQQQQWASQQQQWAQSQQAQPAQWQQPQQGQPQQQQQQSWGQQQAHEAWRGGQQQQQPNQSSSSRGGSQPSGGQSGPPPSRGRDNSRGGNDGDGRGGSSFRGRP